jgi:HlyD family secretion protein
LNGCWVAATLARTVDKNFQVALLALLFLANACAPHATPSSVSGTIETDEIHVASRYGGRVAAIFAGEGDSLTNGQVIAELDAAELAARREQAAAMLAEWTAGPRREEIAAAKNDWEALTAELEFARTDERRARELFAAKTVSETERDRAVTRVSVLEKSAKAAKSRYELLLAGTRPERLAQARAQVAELDAEWREMRILAPTNCLLEVLSVKVGDVLPPHREVATLLLTQHLWVRVYVPEPWLGHVKVGDTVQVRTDSFPGKDFEGRVEQISRSAEFTPRNVQTVGERIKQVFGVKIGLRNQADQLRAGMSVDAFFPSVPVAR